MDDIDAADRDYLVRRWGGHPDRLAELMPDREAALLAAKRAASEAQSARLRAYLARAEKRRDATEGIDLGEPVA